jgi:kynureninase
MAEIVYIYANNQTGQEALGAIRQIAQGFATLDRLDGLRANSIGVSAATMQSNFGALTTAQAQALSDRWAGIVAWYNGAAAWMTTAAEVRQALHDLVDATTVAAT